jgi:hypothetical protein
VRPSSRIRNGRPQPTRAKAARHRASKARGRMPAGATRQGEQVFDEFDATISPLGRVLAVTRSAADGHPASRPGRCQADSAAVGCHCPRPGRTAAVPDRPSRPATAAAWNRLPRGPASSRRPEKASRSLDDFRAMKPPGKRTEHTDLLPCTEGPKARQAYALRSPAADGKSHPAGTGRAVRASSKRELSPAGAIVPAGRNGVAIIGSVPEPLSARACGDEGP